jgi:Cu-processing system ATP-binding protein
VKDVTLEGLQVHFGKVRALDGVDLTLTAGEITMLAGPNGAGKSTLIDILLGLTRPHAGRMLVDGERRRVDAQFKKRVGYLPEAVAFSDTLSATAVLRFFARARGVPKAKIPAALERVGLTASAKRRVSAFSRGMRQRLGIAVATLAEPELLILDEPTGGLDQQGLSVLLGVMAEWRAAGRMILMASHDLTLFEHRVDRLCLMANGKVVAEGAPEALRERANLPVEVRMRVPDAQAGARLRAHFEGWKPLRSLRQDEEFAVAQVDPAALLEFMDRRAACDASVQSVRVVEPGLDQIYQALLAEVAP